MSSNGSRSPFNFRSSNGKPGFKPSKDPSTYYDRKGWNTPPRQYTGVEGKYYNGPDVYGGVLHENNKEYHQNYRNNNRENYQITESITSKQSRRQKEPKTLKDVFIRFANTTSLQGIPFINTASKWYAKTLWAVIFVVATGIWIAHSYYLINEFLKWNTSSSVEIVYEQAAFPTVTMCNINPVRAGQLGEYGSEELRMLVELLSPRQEYNEDMNAGGLQMTTASSGSTVGAIPTAGASATAGASVTAGGSAPTGATPTGAPPPPGRRKLLQNNNNNKANNNNAAANDNDNAEMLMNFNYGYEDYEDQEDFYVAGSSINWENYIDEYSDYSAVITSNSTSSAAKALASLKDMLADIPLKNRTELGHKLSTMMLSCSYDGDNCNARSFERSMSLDHGNCWSFNSKTDSATVPLQSSRGGASTGLDLTLYIQRHEYLKGFQIGSGVRVHIHPFGTMPFVADNGISVAPGEETYVGMRAIDQQRLGGKYGPCDDDQGEFVSFYNDTYSYTLEGCINTCLTRTITEQCNCFPKTKIQYVPSSKRHHLKACKSDRDSDCVSRFTNMFKKNQLNCGCNQGCNTIDYEAVISHNLWPDDSLWHSLIDAVCVRDKPDCDYFKDVSNDDFETVLRNNFIHLKLYFRDLNVQKIVESASYEWIQFASDFGGAVGLWLGASLITVMEMFDFSFQLCRYCARKKVYRKRKQQLRNDGPFVSNSYPRGDDNHITRPYIEPQRANKLPRLDRSSNGQRRYDGHFGSDNNI